MTYGKHEWTDAEMRVASGANSGEPVHGPVRGAAALDGALEDARKFLADIKAHWPEAHVRTAALMLFKAITETIAAEEERHADPSE